MSTEQIFKLQPDRTLYLRGFTGVGAAASLYKTSPTGFSVGGVFRDMADFCVLNIYDADNVFEHYTVRYLPDFDLSGMILTFDVAYRGLQPLDSAKYSWIDWGQLDFVREDGAAGKIRLWEHAQLVSGNYSTASGSCQFTTGAEGCVAGDRITLFANNVSFEFQAAGGETAGDVAAFFKNAINTYDWSDFGNHSVSVKADADANGKLTLKNGRAGRVSVSGNRVDLEAGIPFTGLSAGSIIYVGGEPQTIASVDSSATLTLAGQVDVQGSSFYLAKYAGLDGNEVSAYFVGPASGTLMVDKQMVHLSGGNSDDVVWRIRIDFTELGIDRLRQAWITFAPQLANSDVYRDTEWTATFSNWTVEDPNGIRRLQCAGLASLRIGNDDRQSLTYSGSGWKLLAANNYRHGFARATGNAGDSITIRYSQPNEHDLYLGTSLTQSRGIVSVTLDENAAADLNCSLDIADELVTRRPVSKGVAGGEHTVTITLQASSGNAGYSDCGFIFDYLEAAVPGDFPDAQVVYEKVSPALDYDTDATYKVSPQRLLWHLQKLGFRGQLNEYLGVFWWNQRKRASGYNGVNVVWNGADVILSDGWAAGDIATIRIGGKDGFAMHKSVTAWDTAETIADHFVYYVNAASVSMWAEKVAPGHIRINTRTPNWGDSLDRGDAADDRITITGTLDPGVDGTWIIDGAASDPVNIAFRNWHSDMFREVHDAGLAITTSFSMELVNTPDDGTAGNEWVARYRNGEAVKTDTGFSNLSSSQCAPVPNVTEYQKAAFKAMAGLQAEAGLTPWLQFGEFLWWFFSSVSQPVGYCAYLDPISIGLEKEHGMMTGDRVVVSGVAGCTAANGTWPITVMDATHFTIPVAANGEWKPGTGTLRGGSMAFYDNVTATAAQADLGRPLARFTCQDDDPSVNDGADAAFLASRLKVHLDAIREDVLAAYPDAKFEILYPNDVNNPVCYLGEQGGRLNAAVNLPSEWKAKETSGLDRFKVEALSWTGHYSNLTLATEAIMFASTAPMMWAAEDTAYLVPWSNGICPWPAEYHMAKNFVPLINFWAYDHLALMSWPLPFPTHGGRSSYFG